MELRFEAIHMELKYCERCGGLWLRPVVRPGFLQPLRESYGRSVAFIAHQPVTIGDGLKSAFPLVLRPEVRHERISPARIPH